VSILPKLASSLGRRDEVPNDELAKQIAATGDKKAVQELVELLGSKNKNIQSGCIKALYEIGSIQPTLISAYTDEFVKLLDSKDNRLQWGAMTALNSITAEKSKVVFSVLPRLAAAADKGSVITRDNYVGILTKLCSIKEYSNDAFDLLNEQLLNSPANQIPMYAENALPVINEKQRPVFAKTLVSRLNDFEKESKRKRLEKVLKKLEDN
jgi:hypothetical protein